MKTLGYGSSVDARAPTGRLDVRDLPVHLGDGSATIRWGEAPLPELVSDTIDGPPPEVVDLFQPGQLIDGKYEIRSVLGSGGMGQVYEARDRGLNRLVALKAAWRSMSPEPLRREAQVLAAFRHPGLVTVHELGSDDGVEFLVMERLSGNTLADHLASAAPLPVDRCIDLLLGICAALAPLHQSGLAHGDLKPANIMLVPLDRVVLLDFGIARIEQLRSGSQRISGSPHYMAPEIIRGEVKTGQAHLVDLYAVGVIAYAMLVGAAPFDHPNPLELMMCHLHNAIPRVAESRRDIPAAVDQLVADLLAKDPADRPADVEALRAELLRFRKK
jgi:serine/threonine-protein kinase